MSHLKSLSILALAFPFYAAASTQILNCRFQTAITADRIHVALSDFQNGTFLYETGDPAGTGTTAALKLKRMSDPEPGLAAFEVQSQAVEMIFKLETSKLFQTGSNVDATLLSRIPEMDLSQEQALTCDSVVK
jgi:hypothetical protein